MHGPRFVIDIKKSLGSGSYGDVFYGVDRETNKAVAIKQMDAEGASELSSVYQEYVAAQLACTLATTAKNEGVVCPIDMMISDVAKKGLRMGDFLQAPSEYEPIAVIVYELAQENAWTALVASKKMSTWDVVDDVAHVASVLAFFHERGLAHNDIKPNNMAYYEGRLRLIDFGRACITNRNGYGLQDTARAQLEQQVNVTRIRIEADRDLSQNPRQRRVLSKLLEELYHISADFVCLPENVITPNYSWTLPYKSMYSGNNTMEYAAQNDVYGLAVSLLYFLAPVRTALPSRSENWHRTLYNAYQTAYEYQLRVAGTSVRELFEELPAFLGYKGEGADYLNGTATFSNDTLMSTYQGTAKGMYTALRTSQIEIDT